MKVEEMKKSFQNKDIYISKKILYLFLKGLLGMLFSFLTN